MAGRHSNATASRSYTPTRSGLIVGPVGETQGELTIRRWLWAAFASDETTLVRLADPDVVVRPLVMFGSVREYRGIDGLRRWLNDERVRRDDVAVTLNAVEAVHAEQV